MSDTSSNPNAIFDSRLLRQRQDRAQARAVQGADFLLDYCVDDLAERLSTIERQFDQAYIINPYTPSVESILQRSGKVSQLASVDYQPQQATEYLPLEPQSADLIISMLSLHLTNDTPGLMMQIKRALKPDGLFLGCMAGAGTLGELREALLQAESELTAGVSPRVAPFADVRDGGALLQRAGFALPVTDLETLTVRYDTMFALMEDLRAMGMANSLDARSRNPVSRKFFMRAAEIYAERFSDPDGRIRATFSFIWLSGWAPHDSQQKPLKPGSATASLADSLAQAQRRVEEDQS